MIWQLIRRLIEMTLHYTDLSNNGGDRLSPGVHGADVQTHPMAKNTASISPRAVGSATSGKVTTKNDQIIVNNGTFDAINLGRQTDGTFALSFSDGSNQRLLIGPDSGGNEVVKISQAGFDASTATNSQLIFNSQQDTLKVVATGAATISADSTTSTNKTTTTSFPHGLSTIPIVLAYIQNSFLGGYTPLPTFVGIGTLQRNFSSPNNGIVLALNQYISAYADSTKVYFTNNFANDNYPSAYSTSAITVKYYLLQETSN
jgi:hypothetical protein